MPAWFSKLKSAAGRGKPSADEAPLPFQLKCQCGKCVEGFRLARYQQIICRDCGEALFVLPRNVYPEPPPESASPAPPKQKKRKRSRQESDSKPDRREPRAKSESKRRPESKLSTKTTQRDQDSPTSASVATEPDDQPVLLKRERVRLRSVFSPFRLIVGAVVLLAAGTIVFQFNRNQSEQAELDFQAAVEAADNAVAEVDFLTAAREYKRAVDALAVLDPGDSRAARLKQAWQQSEVVSHLATTSLFEALGKAARSRESGNWSDRFVDSFGKSWLLMDTAVIRTNTPSGAIEYEIEFPLIVDGAGVAVVCGENGFDELDFPDGSRRAVFAARVAECTFDDSESPRWIVTLDADSIVIWDSLTHYRAAGFDPVDEQELAELEAVLSEQQTLLGVDE